MEIEIKETSIDILGDVKRIERELVCCEGRSLE